VGGLSQSRIVVSAPAPGPNALHPAPRQILSNAKGGFYELNTGQMLIFKSLKTKMTSSLKINYYDPAKISRLSFEIKNTLQNLVRVSL
jgi:hypothetical protein